MGNVGPGPQGSSADSLAHVPHLRNQEQPAPLPATQRPTLPVVAHTELLLTGEPPPAHPLSGGSGGLPSPSHVHTATVSTTAAPPSRRGGPSLWRFPATRQFSVWAPLLVTCITVGRLPGPH